MGTNTTNRLLNQPTVGGDNSAWGPPLNTNETILDQILSQQQTVSFASASGNVSLTQTQMQYNTFVLTGTPTLSTVALALYQNMRGWWNIYNQTPNPVSVVTANVGTTGTTCLPGITTLVYSDGTNVTPYATGEVGRVVTTGTSITVTAYDQIVIINKTVSSSTTVVLPAGGWAGTIKDGKGDAVQYPITVTVSGGGAIDGALSYPVNTAYGAATFTYSTQYNVVANVLSVSPVNVITRVAKTADYSATYSDIGKEIVNSGTNWTLTLPNPTVAGAGWWLLMQNSGSGKVLLSPAAGTIDALANYYCYQGETRLITTDGANYFTTVLNPFYLTITASTTFVTPPGYSGFSGYADGAGAGGGSSGAGGFGGGGGARVVYDIALASWSAAGASCTVTIGSGGTGGVASGAAATDGGNTTLSTGTATITAYGGQAGNSQGGAGGGVLGSPSGTAGGAPAVPTGTGATFGGANATTSSVAGGASIYGGAAGGYGNNVGGSAAYGGAGGGGASNSAGASGGTTLGGTRSGGAGATSGTATAGGPACGGGGNYNGTAGDGGRGEVLIAGRV